MQVVVEHALNCLMLRCIKGKPAAARRHQSDRAPSRIFTARCAPLSSRTTICARAWPRFAAERWRTVARRFISAVRDDAGIWIDSFSWSARVRDASHLWKARTVFVERFADLGDPCLVWFTTSLTFCYMAILQDRALHSFYWRGVVLWRSFVDTFVDLGNWHKIHENIKFVPNYLIFGHPPKCIVEAKFILTCFYTCLRLTEHNTTLLVRIYLDSCMKTSFYST